MIFILSGSADDLYGFSGPRIAQWSLMYSMSKVGSGVGSPSNVNFLRELAGGVGCPIAAHGRGDGLGFDGNCGVTMMPKIGAGYGVYFANRSNSGGGEG